MDETLFHLVRDRTQLGQMTGREVALKLQDGTFAKTDLCWHKGMKEWLPLANVFGALPTPVTTQPPPLPGATRGTHGQPLPPLPPAKRALRRGQTDAWGLVTKVVLTAAIAAVAAGAWLMFRSGLGL